MGLIALSSGSVLHTAGSSGAPLLFLHGVGGGAWSWLPQSQRFSRDYKTFVWEARGHGYAQRVADAGLQDYYVDAREALAAVAAGCREAPVVVAHSMGGLLAIALAANSPNDVAGLFLIDPVYSDGQDSAYGHFLPGTGQIMRVLCEPILRSFESNGWLSRVIARRVFEGAFSDRERMEAAWQFQRRQVPFEYRRLLAESFVRPEGFELRDFAREIRAPTALLDRARSGAQPRFPKLVAALKEQLGGGFAHHAIAGGHYLQLDRPEEVNAYLDAFLRARALS